MGTDGYGIIDSYNHAIERINNYTANLVTNTNKISVRSVGSNPSNPNYRNTEKYTSDHLATLNVIAERGDNNLEKDFVRMAYWGVLSTGSRYWLASRHIYADSDSVFFNVDAVNLDGSFLDVNFYRDDTGGGCSILNSAEFAMRPVVKISLNS